MKPERTAGLDIRRSDTGKDASEIIISQFSILNSSFNWLGPAALNLAEKVLRITKTIRLSETIPALSR